MAKTSSYTSTLAAQSADNEHLLNTLERDRSNSGQRHEHMSCDHDHDRIGVLRSASLRISIY